jgi:hypothetical protein
LTTVATDITDDKNFGLALEQQVTACVAMLDLTKTKPSRIHSKAGKPFDAEMLAKCWLIPTNCGARRVDRTMQWGVQICLHPTLSRRFRTNDWILCYPCKPHPVFGNNMFAGIKSKNGNKVCQVFATNFGWAHAHPVKQKGEAHKALLLMFKHDGVLPEMIKENSSVS